MCGSPSVDPGAPWRQRRARLRGRRRAPCGRAPGTTGRGSGREVVPLQCVSRSAALRTCGWGASRALPLRAQRMPCGMRAPSAAWSARFPCPHAPLRSARVVRPRPVPSRSAALRLSRCGASAPPRTPPLQRPPPEGGSPVVVTRDRGQPAEPTTIGGDLWLLRILGKEVILDGYDRLVRAGLRRHRRGCHRPRPDLLVGERCELGQGCAVARQHRPSRGHYQALFPSKMPPWGSTFCPLTT